MRPFIIPILAISLLASCAKPDTPPNSPTVTGKWYYQERGLDEDTNGVFSEKEITNFPADHRIITLTFNADRSGVYEESGIAPTIPFIWFINGNQLNIQWPDNKYIPDIPSSQFTLDSLTTHTMYLSNEFMGFKQYFLFYK